MPAHAEKVQAKASPREGFRINPRYLTELYAMDFTFPDTSALPCFPIYVTEVPPRCHSKGSQQGLSKLLSSVARIWEAVGLGRFRIRGLK